MPTIAVYVPASIYREVEKLAPANGYETADDMVRAVSLATLDELVTGVAMSREVRVPTGSGAGGSAAVSSDEAAPRESRTGVAPGSEPASDDHFKPDPKPERKKK